MNVQIGQIYKIKKGREGECNTYEYKHGKSIKITDTDGYSLDYQILDSTGEVCETCDCFTAVDLEPIEKTLYNLVEGDIIEDGDGNKSEILGVCGKVYILSRRNNFDLGWGFYTVKELEKDGYKPVSQEPSEEKTIDIEGTYYTIAEIKKALKKLEE